MTLSARCNVVTHELGFSEPAYADHGVERPINMPMLNSECSPIFIQQEQQLVQVRIAASATYCPAAEASDCDPMPAGHRTNGAAPHRKTFFLMFFKKTLRSAAPVVPMSSVVGRAHEGRAASRHRIAIARAIRRVCILNNAKALGAERPRAARSRCR